MFIEQSHKGLTLLYPSGNVNTFGQIEDLVGAINRFMQDKPFIVQQWIELATWKKRRFDIRVLLQKVSLNHWDCTALSIRMALPSHGSTNISQGGEVKQVSLVLLDLWPSRYLEIIATIKELAFNVAQKLEFKYGPLGELGIDIGIDRNGGVWLFEVNSKPGKVTVRKLKEDDLIQHAYQRPLLYAEMLLKEKYYGNGA
jgi:glutathione synthase/RimK-type ligase-like ATP-grasp enzyme